MEAEVGMEPPQKSEKELAESRKRKVKELQDVVKADLKKWDYAFKRMKEWRKFARGLQWPGTTSRDMSDPDRPYTANITMRHLHQRTDATYARNPRFIFRRTKRMNNRVWDGTAQQLAFASQMVEQGIDLTGMYGAILEDAMNSRTESKVIEKVGETLTCLYEYMLREQNPPAKKMMKKQVRSSLTCGVSYIRQTFQRATEISPDVERAISDNMAQLAKLQRLSEEMAEGEFSPEDSSMEDLRLQIEALEGKREVILREGLAFDYPDPTNIIPSKDMTYLPGFVGCGHVTEQYCLSKAQVKEVYGVDLKDGYTAYNANRLTGAGEDDDRANDETARVWEIWHKGDNLVYTVCDGYDDYLIEPHEPKSYTDRFYPWFVFAPNVTDGEDDPFPPSDVELITPMQMEINRGGEGLRQHRIAARPGHVTGANVSEEDAMKMASRKAHDVVTLQGLKPDSDIRAMFQAFPTNPIDPNLYATGPAFTDIQRTTGSQEANLGGTSNSTATESSIAESSRQTSRTSTVDEFDDLLSEMARAGGQILLSEMSSEKVMEIVGPGAVWPEQSREDIAKEIHLEVVAGSSGRPNQAQEVQVRERMLPLLFQIPGIKPEMLAKDALKVMDDTINYEDWIDMDALPIVAMNGQMQAQANRGDMQEGGANNAQKPPAPGPTGPSKPGQAGFGETV